MMFEKLKKIVKVLCEEEELPKKEEPVEQAVETVKFQSFDEIVLDFHKEFSDLSEEIQELKKSAFKYFLRSCYLIIISFSLLFFWGFLPKIVLLPLLLISSLFITNFNKIFEEKMAQFDILVLNEIKRKNKDSEKLTDFGSVTIGINHFQQQWIYRKFGTKELSNHLKEFTEFEDKLFLYSFENPLDLLENKFIYVLLLVTLTFFLQHTMPIDHSIIDVSYIIKIFSDFCILLLIYSIMFILKAIYDMKLIIKDIEIENTKITKVRKQKFLIALRKANRYKVYQ